MENSLVSSPAKRGLMREGASGRRSRRRGRHRGCGLPNKPIGHFIRVRQHVSSRNALHRNPPRRQPSVSHFIPLRLSPHVVPPPVHLHRQPRRWAVEVEHVRSNCMLPPKPRHPIASCTKPQPELHLRRRHLRRSRLAADLTRSVVLILNPHRRRRPLRHGAYPHRATSPAFAGEEMKATPSPSSVFDAAAGQVELHYGTPRVPTPTGQPPRAGRVKVEPQARLRSRSPWRARARWPPAASVCGRDPNLEDRPQTGRPMGTRASRRSREL